MADYGDMNVKIGADLSGLLSKVDAAKAKLNQLKESQQELKDKIKDLNNSIRDNEKEIVSNTSKLNSFNTSTKKGKDALVKLRAELKQNALNAKDLSAQLSATKSSFAATTTEIKAQAAAIKKAETAGSRFAKGATKIYSGLRKLAYIIPGMGIAGLISLISGPLIDAFSEWISTMNDAKVKAKAIAEAISGSSSEYIKAANNVESLKNEIDLAKQGFLDKDEVVKHYNETIGKTTGFVKSLDEAEKELNKNAEAYIKFTFLKAVANQAYDAAAKKAFEAEQTRMKGLKEFSSVLDAQNNFNIRSAKEAENANKQITDKEKERKKKQVDTAQKASDDILLIAKEFEKQAADIAKGFDFKFFDDKGGAKTIKHIETISDVIAKMNAQIDVLNKKEILQGVSLAPEKVKVIEKAIDELLTKFKLLTDDPHIVQLQAKIGDINLTEQFKKELHFDKNEPIPVPLKLDIEATPDDVRINPTGAFNEAVLRDQLFKELKKRGITKTATIQIGVDITGKPQVAKGGDTITPATSTKELMGALDNGNDRLNEMYDMITNTLSPAFDALFEGILSGSQNAFQSFGEALQKTIVQLGAAVLKAAAFAAIFSAITGDPFGGTFKKILGFSSGGRVPGFANGGQINGPGSGTSDSILARVSRGEYIIKSDVVNRLGVGFFDKINKGFSPKFDSFGFPRFASGGLISPNVIRASSIPSLSGLNIGGGQLIEITGDFQLRNDRLVAAVNRGNAQVRRNV